MPLKFVRLLFVLFFICRIGISQQIQFANTYFSSGFYRINNFIELNDSSFIILSDKANGPSSPHTQYLIHIKSNGDTLNSHEYFYGYITDGIAINDSIIKIMPVGWNQISGINMVDINVNSWDSSGYHFYGVVNQGWSGGLFHANDRGYLLSNISAGNYNLIKLDSTLTEQWHSSTAYSSHGQLVIDSLNNILVTCEIQNAALRPYAYSYFNSAGTLLWAQSYGNNIGQFSGTYINGTVITADSNFLAFTGGYDWQLMKINHLNGDTIWTKQFPRQISCGFSIAQNRHFVFTRYNNVTTEWLIDDEGNIIFSQVLPIIFTPVQAHKTKDGGFAVCGTYSTGAPQWIQLPVLMKFDSLGNTTTTSVFNPQNNYQPLSFYPNPATSELFLNPGNMATEQNLLFTLTDLQGRAIMQQPYIAGTINVSAIPQGIYIATLKGKEKEVRGKVVIQR